MISAVKSIVQIISSILLGLAAIIIILFVIPFGFGLPFAIPLLVVFIINSHSRNNGLYCSSINFETDVSVHYQIFRVVFVEIH